MYVIINMILSVFIAVTLSNSAASKKASSKIVFVPLPVVSSQYFNMLFLAEEMANRGHEVSILTTPALRKRKSIVKHVDYELSEEEEFLKKINKHSSQKQAAGPTQYIQIGRDAMIVELNSCHALLTNNKTVQEILEADVIVSLSVMVCGIYAADIFDKPFIILHPGFLSIIGSYVQVPMPPSYVPVPGATLSDKMGFFDRVLNFLKLDIKNIMFNMVVTYYFREIQAKFNPKSTESFASLFGKAEMYIVTTDFAYDFVHPIMPDVFLVGPITAKPAAPLPDDLERFMQSSGDDGVVVISFGSAISKLDGAITQTILHSLSRLKQKVIWKLKVKTSAKVPKNVKIVDWLPQNDLLGHPKTKAFVSHMGLNGASEAAYHGVPIVAACIMSDSYYNDVKFGTKAKMTKFIDVYGADAEVWQATIEEVINNSSYKDNAMRTSKLLRSWPRSSLERAGDLIQYALDNGGRLPHLKSYAGNLYWFQYHCVDVIMFLISCCAIIIFVLIKVAKLCLSFICNIGKKSKRD